MKFDTDKKLSIMVDADTDSAVEEMERLREAVRKTRVEVERLNDALSEMGENEKLHDKPR